MAIRVLTRRLHVSTTSSKLAKIQSLSKSPPLPPLSTSTSTAHTFSEPKNIPLPPSLSQKLLEHSRSSRADPGSTRRGVLLLKGMGFTDDTIITVIDESPLAFSRDSCEIREKVEMLKRFGLGIGEIDGIFRRFPGLLELSLDRKLRPSFRELRDLGFARGEVRDALRGDPGALLAAEAGEMSRCVELLGSLKCRMPVKERILRKGALGAAVAVKRRVDCLRARGLSRRDAFKVLFVEPRVVSYDLEDVERKIMFLVHNMKFHVGCLVDFPAFLGVSLERQIVPRHNVIEHLRSVGGLGDPVGMKHYVRLSRLRFYNLFVKPYPECEKIFGGGMVREKEPKPPCHPVGMWKLFKPKKFPETEEDVKNMKLFMESAV